MFNFPLKSPLSSKDQPEQEIDQQVPICCKNRKAGAPNTVARAESPAELHCIHADLSDFYTCIIYYSYIIITDMFCLSSVFNYLYIITLRSILKRK